jgi:hypothetical protein
MIDRCVTDAVDHLLHLFAGRIAAEHIIVVVEEVIQIQRPQPLG